MTMIPNQMDSQQVGISRILDLTGRDSIVQNFCDNSRLNP